MQSSMVFPMLGESSQHPVPPKFVMITRTPVESPRTPARSTKTVRPSPRKPVAAVAVEPPQTASASAPPPPPPPLPMMGSSELGELGVSSSGSDGLTAEARAAAAAAAALDRQAYAQWTFAEDCALLSFLKSRGLLGKKLKERQMKDLEAEKIPELHARRTFKAIYNRYNKHLAGPAKAACLNEDKNAQESSDPFLWLRRLRREAAAPPVSRTPKSPRAKRKRAEERASNRSRGAAAGAASASPGLHGWTGSGAGADDDGLPLMPMGEEIVMIPIDEDMDGLNALVGDKDHGAFFSTVAGGATASLDDALHASIHRLHDGELIDDDMEIDIELDMDTLAGSRGAHSHVGDAYSSGVYKRSNTRDSGDDDVQHVSNSNSPQAHSSSSSSSLAVAALPLGAGVGVGGAGDDGLHMDVVLDAHEGVWVAGNGTTGAQWERSRDDGQALFFDAFEVAIENK